MSQIYNWTVTSIRLLAMPGVPNKLKLVALYARFQLKLAILRFLKMNSQSERFLGFQFRFFDYATFVYLFEEIFMNQTYHFRADSERPVVFDCGSNVGLAVLYFKWLYPLAQVTAFEPDPEAFACLTENISLNQLKDVYVHCVAIADFDGQMSFFKDNHQASARMGQQRREGLSTEIKVSCRRLQNFLKSPIDLLKMDIEGGEGSCFVDFDKAKLLPLIKKIILEGHHNLQNLPVVSKVFGVLEKNDFEYVIAAPIRAPIVKVQAQDLMVYATPKVRAADHAININKTNADASLRT